MPARAIPKAGMALLAALGGQIAAQIACGAGTPLDVDEGYRAIREHEAALERAEARLRGLPCTDTVADSRELCAASEAVCGVAVDIEESDARLRCERARQRCAQTESSAGQCTGAER
jgi:hypothetical protein